MPQSYVEFVDLCTVANISMIMFNEELRGYYIHGKSPSGGADVSAEKLRLNIVNEKQGKATIRGIHPSYADAQTFEIFLPDQIIDSYRKNFLTPVINDIDKSIRLKHVNYNALQRTISNNPAIPENINMTELDQTKELMNKIMKKYIDQVRAEPTTYIKDKTPIQRLFNLQPNEQKIMMFRDKMQPSYSKSLLQGLEFDFMMLECLVIACMDRA